MAEANPESVYPVKHEGPATAGPSTTIATAIFGRDDDSISEMTILFSPSHSGWQNFLSIEARCKGGIIGGRRGLLVGRLVSSRNISGEDDAVGIALEGGEDGIAYAVGRALAVGGLGGDVDVDAGPEQSVGSG